MFFVRPDGSARYIAEEAEREEGGTPNVVGCIRTGLVMQLQYAVGYAAIDALESAMANEARRVWSAHPNIAVAGNTSGKRVSIVSFNVSGGLISGVVLSRAHCSPVAVLFPVDP